MRAVLRRFYGENCDTDAIIAALHAQAEIAFQAPPPKKPGLDDLIAWLEAQHIPMVVASSSRMASILRHLNNWNMTGHFKAVISGEQFTSSKPDPEIFLTAAKALGTAPSETLVLEDSYNGVRAGARGGFVTVMVPDLSPADDEMRRLYTAECKNRHNKHQLTIQLAPTGGGPPCSACGIGQKEEGGLCKFYLQAYCRTLCRKWEATRRERPRNRRESRCAQKIHISS